MKPTRFITAAAITTLLAGASIGATYAATNQTDHNPMATLVDAIATKFNLDEAAVQAVFDEQRSQFEAQHTQEFTDRINQAVTDGDLTQSQADLIIAKRAELESQRQNLDSASETDRHEAMKTTFESVRQWGIDNDIPREFMPLPPPHDHDQAGEHGN